MAKISVSSGCFVTHDYRIVRESFERCNPDCFELIIYKSILSELGSLKDSFMDFDNTICSIHAPKPVQIMLSNPQFQSNALRLLERSVDITSDLGATIMVIHAWDGRYRQLPMEHIKATMRSLVTYARDRGITVSIEALPSRCRHPIDLTQELLGCCDEITFTLDFEYAAAYNMFDGLIEMADRMSNVHLRDFNGKWIVDGRRSYLRPGRGDLDFKDLISKIRAAGYDSNYTFEAPYDDIGLLNSDIERFRALI